MLHAHLLSGNSVQVQGSRGEPLSGNTTAAKALGLVQGGRAVVVGPNTIRVLWMRAEFNRHILRRDNRTCQYCGDPGSTIDHIIPRSRGGFSTPANCLCACEACNLEKADRTLQEYWSFVHARPCRCLTARHRKSCHKHRVLGRLELLLTRSHNLPEPTGHAVHVNRSPRKRRRRRHGPRSSAATVG